MNPRICVSVLPRTLPEALKLIEKAEEKQADFIEIRLDLLDEDSDLTVLAENRETPLIATDKATDRDVAERRALLLNAAKSGFRYVDVDLTIPKLKSLIGEIKASGAKCIVSYHDYKGCPSPAELHGILAREIADGADVCKIVVTVNKMEENVTLLEFTAEASKQTDVVCFGMGELGRNSRLQSPLFGGLFTFASLDGGCETAPGQMTLREMRAAYELLGLR
jgi:3-dehydroquinate dehydratase type I